MMTSYSMSFIVARTYVLAIKGGQGRKALCNPHFLRHLEYETYLQNLKFIIFFLFSRYCPKYTRALPLYQLKGVFKCNNLF